MSSNYQDPIEQLSVAGIRVTPEDPEYIRRIVTRLLNNEKVSHIRYCVVQPTITTSNRSDTKDKPDTSQKERILTISWSIEHNAWVLVSVEGHGWFHKNDFICQFQTFDRVVEVVLDFYFGTPTIISNWVIAFHRHPELDKAQAQVAIAQAQRISRGEFEIIRTQIKSDVVEQKHSSDWEQAMRSDFHYFPHQYEADLTCAILRNAQTAYVIAN